MGNWIKLHDVACRCWICELDTYWFSISSKTYKIVNKIMMNVRSWIYEMKWKFWRVK